ncbi:hypothetical protein ACFL6N_00900 [Thermodesulfobacteriota bacterium]
MTSPSDPDKNVSADDSSIGLDTDWGEDWESAFQAEEMMFSSKGTGGEEDSQFFLDDESESTGVSSDTAQQTSTPADDQQSDLTQSPKFSGIEGTPTFSQLLTLASALTVHYRNNARNWFLGLKLYQRLLVSVLGVTVPVLLALAVWILVPEPLPEQPTTLLSPPLTEEIPAAIGPSEEIRDAETLPDTPPPVEAVAGPKMHWQFHSFIIPATINNEEKDRVFVFVDLTLLTSLHEGEELPADKRQFVREIVYQFFSNRPFYELRRYSLARGEMGRKLQNWLNKQWPDNPVESIRFDSYQVS